MTSTTGTLVNISEDKRPLSQENPEGIWRALYTIDITGRPEDLNLLQGWQDMRGRKVRISVSEITPAGPTTVIIQ